MEEFIGMGFRSSGFGRANVVREIGGFIWLRG